MRDYFRTLMWKVLKWFIRRIAPKIEKEALKHPGVVDTEIYEWPEYGPVLYIEATDEDYEIVAEEFATGALFDYHPGEGHIRMVRDAEEATSEVKG